MSSSDEETHWTDRHSSVTVDRAPWPVPAGWTLRFVEGDGVMWQRFPGVGEGMGRTDDVYDLFEDGAELEDARGETAHLEDELLDLDMRAGTESHEYTFEIDGETIFRREDPEWEDLKAAIADALARYANGQDMSDVGPETGRPPEDVRQQRELERKQNENQSLTDFGGQP